MTRAEFNARFATEYAKFQTSDMFKALMELAFSEGPVAKPGAASYGDITVGGHVLCAEIYGYERFRKLLHNVSETPESEPLPATYEADDETTE